MFETLVLLLAFTTMGFGMGAVVGFFAFLIGVEKVEKFLIPLLIAAPTFFSFSFQTIVYGRSAWNLVLLHIVFTIGSLLGVWIFNAFAVRTSPEKIA